MLLLWAAAASAQPRPSSRWLEEILDVAMEIMDQVELVVETLEWAGEVANAREEDRPLPPAPPKGVAGDQIESVLLKLRDRVRGLEPPSFTAPLPATGPVPTSSFDASRQEILRRVEIFLTAAGEAEEAQAALESLTQLGDTFATRQKVASALGDVLLDTAGRVPLEELQKELVFKMTDIRLTYIPLLEQAEAAARQKESRVRTLLRARSSELTAAGVELRNLLVVEAAALRLEAQRLAMAAEALRRRQEALAKRRAALDLEEAALTALARRIEELRAAARTNENLMNNLRSQITEAQQERQSYIEGQRRNFRCTAGFVWDRCGEHPDQKRKFDERSADSDYVRHRDRRISGYQKEIRDRQAEANAWQQEAGRLDRELGHRRTTHRASSDGYWQDIEAYRQDVEADLRDRWKSRADLHAAENAGDARQIEIRLARLPELGK